MGYKLNYWCFIVLCLIGGFIGMQEFYRGKYFLGFLGVLFCWTGIPYIISWIEAMVWLFRGEEDFYAKYC